MLIVTTSESGHRFQQSKSFFEEPKPSVNPLFLLKSVVTIDRSKKNQKFIGFGSAFTGAVSFNLKLVPSLNENIFKSYYSNKTGLGFKMMRIPIGGTDADLSPWAYNELPEHDENLTGFVSLDQRDVDRVEQLKHLMNVTENFDIKLIGSAWR